MGSKDRYPPLSKPRQHKRYSKAFFDRDAQIVARELIGSLLIREDPEFGTLVTQIIETEAYRGDDPACHAYHLWKSGKSPKGRAAGLYEAPGTAYVYLNYGIHWLLNVVTDAPGVASAVLIRGVTPVLGREVMQSRRPKCLKPALLGVGPGNVTKILGIDQSFHGMDLLRDERLYLARGRQAEIAKLNIGMSSRIGISKGQDLQWRFVDTAHYATSNVPATKLHMQ